MEKKSVAGRGNSMAGEEGNVHVRTRGGSKLSQRLSILSITISSLASFEAGSVGLACAQETWSEGRKPG